MRTRTEGEGGQTPDVVRIDQAERRGTGLRLRTVCIRYGPRPTIEDTRAGSRFPPPGPARTREQDCKSSYVWIEHLYGQRTLHVLKQLYTVRRRTGKALHVACPSASVRGMFGRERLEIEAVARRKSVSSAGVEELGTQNARTYLQI